MWVKLVDSMVPSDIIFSYGCQMVVMVTRTVVAKERVSRGTINCEIGLYNWRISISGPCAFWTMSGVIYASKARSRGRSLLFPCSFLLFFRESSPMPASFLFSVTSVTRGYLPTFLPDCFWVSRHLRTCTHVHNYFLRKYLIQIMICIKKLK